jgi:hypothetical protein
LKHRAKMPRRLGTACALALVFVCISPRVAAAQEPAAGSTAEAPKPKAKTASPKKHATAAADESRADASAPATKAHPASHPPAGTHPKSNAAVAARSKTKHASSHKSSRRKTTARGQQKIDPERAQAIQEALIREHYLSGAAAGTWNQSSEEAMRRYQADHGWQSKTVPDSRALISLGLGPSHDHLLNPESAMTTGPFPTRSSSSTPVSHSDPGARMKTKPTPPVEPTPATTTDHNPSSPQ